MSHLSSLQRPFNKVLIANRGEIALRIIVTAKAMGYRTVAVYSDIDQDHPHVTAAHQAVLIGPAPGKDSYLNIEKLIEAAQLSQADAIHPGYGFLAESADFAERCQQARLVFIGPPAPAIRLMGDKKQAKIAAAAAGIPCLPGYNGEAQDNDSFIQAAAKITYPLLIKAVAGGGGRGMRLVTRVEDLPEHLASARSEAKNSCGDGRLILEKYLDNARHIEIQIFADGQGNCVHLGERDCSIQRRHQKVIEECPSPMVSAKLRQRLGAAALAVTRLSPYLGAGTVEFMLCSEHQQNHPSTAPFYFLEMNTRLQVEHAVTEMVTGLDLVAWQFKVAAGEPLPLQQKQIQLTGHAIEARLYAEDPAQQFMPQTGKIIHWHSDPGPGVRVDHSIKVGQNISSYYDPLLAKFIAFGCDRHEARRRLLSTLLGSSLMGVVNNKQFLANILQHRAFIDGTFNTHFIVQQFADDASLQKLPPPLHIAGLAAVLSACQHASDSWSNSNFGPQTQILRYEGQTIELIFSADAQYAGPGSRWFIQSSLEPRQQLELAMLEIKGNLCRFSCQHLQESIYFYRDQTQIIISYLAKDYRFTRDNVANHESLQKTHHKQYQAPMDGQIVSLAVKAKDRVKAGQLLLVLEAMKMEHQIKAAVDAEVKQILVEKGQQVKANQLLICLD